MRTVVLCVGMFFFGVQAESVDCESKFNLAARKIAGIHVEEGAQNDEDQAVYAKSIEQSWNALVHNNLEKIPSWTDKNLISVSKDFDTVFYPFGGPDIPYALSFFPKARHYVLVGLEPTGSFVRIEKSLGSRKFYQAIEDAFSTYLCRGYFITSEMMTQLSNSHIKGVLSLMLLELSRMGFDIVEVKSIGINEDGKVVDSDTENISCIKIVFKRHVEKKSEEGNPRNEASEENDERKTVYYIRLDLSNENPRLKHLIKFVHSFEFATFIKSASYALHNRNFSDIRSFILNESNCVLQDDTGIPFNFFRKDWGITVFGRYTGPRLKVFKVYKQPKLTEYYATHACGELPFPIGYGRAESSNLMLMISNKKQIARQINALKMELKKKSCGCSGNARED